jgi:hypothetical protein
MNFPLFCALLFLLGSVLCSDLYENFDADLDADQNTSFDENSSNFEFKPPSTLSSLDSFSPLYKRLRTAYAIPYYELCEDLSLKQDFIEDKCAFSLEVKDLLSNLSNRIELLNSLFKTFSSRDDFWVYFWTAACSDLSEDDASQTCLLNGEEHSPLSQIRSPDVLDEVIQKINFYIQILDGSFPSDPSEDIIHAKACMYDLLMRFKEYRH